MLCTGKAIAQDESVEEEKEAQIWKVVFKGNKVFATVVLKEQVASEAPTFWEKLKFWDDKGHPFDEIMVKKDVIRIRNFYHRRGFHDVEVSYRVEEMGKSWKKKLFFEVDENAPIRINNLDYVFETENGDESYIKNSREFERIQRRQPFQPGKRYEIIKIPEVVGGLEDVFKNLGFPYANVSIDAKIDTAKLAADVTITSDTGPRATISEMHVEGVRSISENYVKRESGIRPGDQYSLEKIQDAQRELFNHHLFQFVTISIPEQEEDSTLDLQMRVREAPLRTVETSIGFSTADVENKKFPWIHRLARGQVSWIHRNAFGEGHRFTASGSASFIQQLVSLDYLFPYIYNNKSSIVISPFGEHQLEKSFELFTGGITNSFIYRYRQNLTGTISYELTKNLELSKKADASLPDTTLEYDLSSLQLSGYYSQGFSREQQGWVIQPYLELSGFLNFATFKFQKASIDVRRFTKLTNSTMLATRVQAGGLVNASADSLPRNIRFFLGGTNSVRGWLRQELGPKEVRFRTDRVMQPDGSFRDTTRFDRYIPIGGRAMLGFNIEIRQELNKLIKGFGIAAFLDGGQIWRSVPGIGDRPVQFGTGGGLRYRSPIGPLRIDIGYKLNPTDADLGIFRGQKDPDFWDRVGIHFSIGQAF